MATGIAPALWRAEDDRTLNTALDILAELPIGRRRGGGGGPQMSG